MDASGSDPELRGAAFRGPGGGTAAHGIHQTSGGVLFTPGHTTVSRRAALGGISTLLAGCRSRHVGAGPDIKFTRIPQADPGGKEKNDIIEGTVKGAIPGQRIVLYARSGQWWQQPLRSNPFTKIQGNAKWTNATHLGTEYAALLVDPAFRPPPTFDKLPSPGGAVAAVAAVRGAGKPPSATLAFSGYEWRLRDAPSNRGGRNLYSPANVSVDSGGAMHLGIVESGKDWSCSEVSLTRSLGYGTYRFVVRELGHLAPALVFGIFTWDYAGGEQGNREMDIEVSRWGNPSIQNAQYVVQPYYVPANVARFTMPPGKVTLSFRWEPGRITFRTIRGAGSEEVSPPVAEHVFASGVPNPGIESVRMNHYVFHEGAEAKGRTSEVVVERFEYLP